MTIRILEEDGLDGYLPTLISLDDHKIRVLEDIPLGIDHKEAIQDWIVRSRLLHSYIFAVQSERNELTAGICTTSGSEFLAIFDTEEGFKTQMIAKPEWWHLGG